jgi:hypothetical protein
MQDYDAGTTSTLEHLPAESTVAVLEAGSIQKAPIRVIHVGTTPS